MEYQRDIADAAASDPYFDRVNAEEIGRHHGEDPGVVLRDIRAARG
jgi:hypothetical protein